MAKKRKIINGGRRGKPAVYCEQLDGIAGRLCEAVNPGCDVLAWILGVSERTVRSWMRRHQGFRKAIETGRKQYDLMPESPNGEGG